MLFLAKMLQSVYRRPGYCYACAQWAFDYIEDELYVLRDTEFWTCMLPYGLEEPNLSRTINLLCFKLAQ